ncbi:hypothetical protein F4859DRAFT_465963, partial [Xylaria cf. heliscus]
MTSRPKSHPIALCCILTTNGVSEYVGGDALPPTRKKEHMHLFVVSAAISSASSVFTGPLITSFSGWSMNNTVRGLWLLGGGRVIREMLLLAQPDPDSTPPIQRVTAIVHIFCLSSLVLYRSRKTDPYRITIIVLVILSGVSLHLFLVFENQDTDTIGTVISILPFLLSLGVILSAILHAIRSSLCTDKSEQYGAAQLKPNIIQDL